MTRLNPDQKAAIEHDKGPLLVLAGAGSGKTMVVTHRMARIIERGTPPGAILAMTFTNKAAEEMASRLEKLVGPSAREATLGTFHAFGLRVLSAEAKNVGFHDGHFAILDQSDQVGVVREILRTIRGSRKWDVWAILSRISKAKNEFIAPDDYVPRRFDEYGDITELVYPKYVEALRAFHAFDFDDLICEVVRLFRKRADVLERWRSRYWYVLVDEYQDTNHAQLELVRLMAEEHRNICVVGDDDQSIYAWRGADVRNILDFEQHFPGAKVVKLQSNYRSTDAILSVANAVIQKSAGRRHEKRLVATRPGGDKVQVVVAANPEVEASFIGDEIRRLLDEGRRARDVAVVYRSNALSEPIETALRQREIPLRVVGGTQFYERKEVKDLMAYLRVLVHPRDEISLRRIINYPARGIGQTALDRLATHALARDMTLWQAVRQASTVSGLPQPALAGCAALASAMDHASQRLDAGQPAAEVARLLVREVGLEADIASGSTSDSVAARRHENLLAFLRVLERHDQAGKRGRDDLADLLRVLSLNTEAEEKDEGNVVTLATMHGTKGLEFEVVFVAGVEEGIIPHARTLEARVTDVDPQDVEEERRLFYVAVTRAKARLYVCRSRHRSLRGRPMARAPSRFLTEVPADLLETRDVRESAPSTGEMLDGIAAVLAALES
jgi:superfamily I DNA/RNA helicase